MQPAQHQVAEQEADRDQEEEGEAHCARGHGRGVAGELVGVADGTGLANCRERLALACGPTARLTLSPRDGGGARARVQLPWTP